MAEQDEARVQLEAEISCASWRKSTYSNAGGDCVEVAFLSAGRVALRDSKNQSGPVLVFNDREWAAFTAGAKEGQFDLR